MLLEARRLDGGLLHANKRLHPVICVENQPPIWGAAVFREICQIPPGTCADGTHRWLHLALCRAVPPLIRPSTEQIPFRTSDTVRTTACQVIANLKFSATPAWPGLLASSTRRPEQQYNLATHTHCPKQPSCLPFQMLSLQVSTWTCD